MPSGAVPGRTCLHPSLGAGRGFTRCVSVSISGGQIPRSLLRLLEAVIVARMSEYIHQSHNVSVLMYHLVCPAKYRRVVFDARVDTVLKEVCLEIAKRYAMIFLEIGTDTAHVHFLFQ